MQILHPFFLVIFLALIVLFLVNEKLKESDVKYALIFVGFLMIIGAGGRDWVGADYPAYRGMYYEAFPLYTTYSDIFDKALFRPNSMEIEWAYVLLNKLIFEFQLPFFVVTMIMAGTSISLQFSTFRKFSPAPFMSILFYFIPIYFISESGQMRQGMGTALCIFSLRYIIKRDLWRFLIVMFFALGMHKSTIVFLPAFWIVKLPLNGIQWVPVLVGSMLLAPFEIYNYFGGVISSLTPQDVSNAFDGYSEDTHYGDELKSGLGDAINLFLIILIVVFDKPARERMPYHEYFRNLALFGYCLYYILRGNTIFATRLPGSYLAMSGYFAIPSLYIGVKQSIHSILKFGFVLYFSLFLYAFSRVNAGKGRFTYGVYNNVFW